MRKYLIIGIIIVAVLASHFTINLIKKSKKITLQTKPPALFHIPHYSNSLVVLEQKTGQILYSYHENILIPPASMTKLVTLYIIYSLIHQGILSESMIVPIKTEAWSRMLPSDATRMFLEPIQKVTLKELMLGLAIPSANDASIAVAQLISGSVENFTKLMNKTVHSLGFKHLFFYDSSGYSNLNYVTALEFAQFCRIYLNRFPESIRELESITGLLFPQNKNYSHKFAGSVHSFYMKNHNPFLGEIKGVDGLKTGFISKSGLNIALSMYRSNFRTITISLGGFGPSTGYVNRYRKKEITMLNDWFYNNYQLKLISHQKLYSLDLSSSRYLLAHVKKDEYFLALKDTKLILHFSFFNPFFINKGDIVGFLEIKDQSDRKIPLYSSVSIPPKNLLDLFLGILYKIIL